MATGEKWSIAASVAVLAALLAVGALAQRWREDTQASLQRIEQRRARPIQSLTAEWPVGNKTERLVTERGDGESFDVFLGRHRACVRAAGGERP